jgi:hypothetical protein
MDREPQLDDRVRTPEGGEGPVVARSETLKGWHIGVRVTNGPLWKGLALDVELVKAAGEDAVLREFGKAPPRRR